VAFLPDQHMLNVKRELTRKVLVGQDTLLFLLLQWACCSPGVYGAMVDALCACHSFILDEF
jgi:hypothetical protein